MTSLPTHPHLRHPLTGRPIRAVYVDRNGRVRWPVIGAQDDPPADPPADPSSDPPADPPQGDDPWVKAFGNQKPEDVKRALDDSRRWEIRSKAHEKAAKQNHPKAEQYDALVKLIQGDGGDEPDPKKLADDLTAAQRDARATKVENVVLRSALTHGADPSRLTDSRSFMEQVAALDPAADDFTTKVGDAIKAAVEKNPVFAVAEHGKPGLKPNPQQGQRSAAKPSTAEQGRAEAERRFGKPAGQQ